MLAQLVNEIKNLFALNPYLETAIILVSGLFMALLAGWIFNRILLAVARRTQNALDDEIIAQMKRPVQGTLILIAVVVAIQLLIEDDQWRGHVGRIFYTLLLVSWTAVAIRMARTFFTGMMRRQRRTTPIVQAMPLFNNLTTVILVVHCAFWVFELWHINATPLLASAGLVTAAVALASKDTLANFFGGISIFVDRPYMVGDYVILPEGERGEVMEIGIRSTRILTRDDVLITVPNAVMSNSKIINQSGMVPRFRVRAQVGVAYDSDPDQVEEVLLSCLEGIPEIMSHPAPRVRFRQFAESALLFDLLAWIHDPADRGRVLHVINRNILRKFRQAAIEIPFPQRVVHVPRSNSPGPEESAGAGD